MAERFWAGWAGGECSPVQSNARQRKLLLKLSIWRKCDKPGTAIVLFLNRKCMQPQKTSAELSDWLEPILEIWSYKKRSLGLLCHSDHTSKAEKKANTQPASRITISGILSCVSTVGLGCPFTWCLYLLHSVSLRCRRSSWWWWGTSLSCLSCPHLWSVSVCLAQAVLLLCHRLDVGLQKWLGLLEASSQRMGRILIVSDGWSFLLYFWLF